MTPNTVFYTTGDVNGDGIQDYIVLTGTNTSPGAFIQDISLEIQDGRTGRITRVDLNENAGYNPRIFLGDFNGDGVEDILISIDSGGSGGIMYHYIYSVIGNMVRLIFDSDKYDGQYEYDIIYRDNFKVEAISRINNERYIIDISDRGDEYLSEIYDRDGRLMQYISGFVNPLSGLYPVDFDSDGIYELLAYQKIAGRYNADSLGYFLNTLKWKDNRFVLYNQNVAIWGSALNDLRE